ncbi:MAG: Coenzyme F420 hydrogenase/dehydrogenase, beta subunit C-terminal domain [Clostridium sp.]|nr:Coenzyme F420 hydrogenase/dehydrogenase, beta subunit C-terminal domain [Clostridium sp.]
MEKNKCTGCYACYNACPKNCISMKRDGEGFSYPQIDINICTNCGLCERICPVLNKLIVETNKSTPDVYAAWSLNSEIRVNSTSGGIFSELALKFLETGGYICGARYGENHHIEHCIVNSKEGLEKIRQSKYAQSDVGYAYRDIKQLLVKGVKVLFCGTPCECAGLLNYLNKKYDNLLIIDFVCRGANSPKVYEKFLEYLEERYHSKIKRVWFKNKTYGWNRFSTKVEFENGESYLEDRNNDMYIVGYIHYNLYMRPSCADCQYKTFPRVSDITLADFWGIKLSNPMLDIENGTSLVMLNSKKGTELFNRIRSSIFFEKKTFKETLKGNPSILESPIMNPKRKNFFKNLDNMSFEKLFRKCCRDDFGTRVRRKIKNAVKKILNSVK